MHCGHELCGEDNSGILLDRYLGHGLERAKLKGDGVGGDDVGRFAELYRRLEFTLGGHYFRAAFTFRFGLFCHCALHVVRQCDVFYLYGGHLRTPRLRVRIYDRFYLLIDFARLGQKLVQAELSDDVAHCRLGYLIGRIVDVLNGDDGLFRICHTIVGDGGDVYRDVVFGDYFLRGYLHRDGAHGYAFHRLEGEEYKGEPRLPHAREFTEKEYDAALVLPQNADGAEEIHDDDPDYPPCHAYTIARRYTHVQPWYSVATYMRDGKKVGITAGAFDLCHAGHILVFKECKTVCDYLIVALQSDPSIDRPEKNKPVMSLEEREIILGAIKYIDEVVVYDTEAQLYELLKKNDLGIDIRIIGDDWKGKEYTGHDLPIPVHFNSRAHHFSTSELRRRVYEVELAKAQKQASG